MKPVRVFDVVPSLPPKLDRLRELAQNLRWAWNHDTVELFRRLDSDLWEKTYHNPVLMLGSIEQGKLEKAARDEAFLAHLERVWTDLDHYLNGDPNWFRRNYGQGDTPLVAYFSAEFGITECLSIFAGGLGVLAGDHLKSASDLGVPLVGVGLLYQQGYFRQYLNASGWQQEAFEDNDFRNLPLSPVRRDGAPLTVSVSLPGREVKAQIWVARVGRVALYLLDTNIEENRPEDRDITDQLYGGDLDMRLRQEIVLGIGGLRALAAVGLAPTVYHMNEGHSAFLGLEHIRRLMREDGLTFGEAREVASASLVFTTHTPVEAGHDYFPGDLIERYFSEMMADLGVSRRDFLALGRHHAGDEGERFCMTILALRLSAFRNGVSRLHGAVSRRMWAALWPGAPQEEVPIGHVTNGVHFRSWISYEMNQLYDRYLGPAWRREPGQSELWRRVESIPPEELWRTHERRRERLVAFARKRLYAQLKRRGAPQAELDAAEEALDPETLTIGFARRFATYKRGTLLFRDIDRLTRILAHAERPVQLIVAGKAHPKDDAGKELIRQIAELARREQLRHRLVFLEDYDVSVARYLVQGSDVWLNTPLRPMEASGTSGMKALANGALNLSVLDGWWDEAWQMENERNVQGGWAIGRGESYEDAEYQNQVEAGMLYDLLESDVAQTFYDRGRNGIPRRWVGRMKASIATLCPFFNTHRMVQEYTERFYLVAHSNCRKMRAEGAARARALAAWSARLAAEWPQVRVRLDGGLPPGELKLGEAFDVRALVRLGSLDTTDVHVQLYSGALDASGELAGAGATPMRPAGRADSGEWVFEGQGCSHERTGRHGYTARVVPSHPDLAETILPGMIAWAE
jgi:starch phosphorylase